MRPDRVTGARRRLGLALAALAFLAIALLACLPFELPAATSPTQGPAGSPTSAAGLVPATSPPAGPTSPAIAPSPTALDLTPPSPARTATPVPPSAASPAAEAATSAIARPPDRDLVDLARRLKPGPVLVATPVTSPVYQVGDRQTFWVLDQASKAPYQVGARIVYITDHLYIYLADGISLPLDRLKASADLFERQTYSALHRYFGAEWTPGIDGDVHLTILNARIPGLAGYYSVPDEYPRSVNEYSNEREMFYINVDAVSPGTPAYDSTLAHEFTHMIQFNTVRGGDVWLLEGTAELGAKAAGQTGGGASRLFLSNPDLQLTEWAEPSAQAVPHYGAAYLFANYFAQHYGGYGAVGRLLAEGARGQASFDAYLARRGLGKTFDDIFEDWVVANYLDDEQVGRGEYGYQEPNVRARAEVIGTYPARKSATVQPYGADYYQLQGLRGDVTISFAGQGRGRLVDNDPRGARAEWWSNRGDSIDSRLTRRVDLSGPRTATLQFWIWHDVEADFDYGFVEVSADGGRTWKTLPGRSTTTKNPNGGNYGNGFTGRSGGGSQATWVQEEMDLTPYAGREVLLRFEYVTDDAYNAQGFGLDGITIPELGFRDDAETDDGWTAEGFVRIDNRVAERYSAQVIARGRATTVQSISLDAEARGQVVVRGIGPGRDVEDVVVVVAGLTPLTTRPEPYELVVTPSGS